MRWSIVTLLAACGGSPLIESGSYEVDVAYTRDDWPQSLANTTSSATWNIDENDGQYTLDVADSSTRVTGAEAEGGVVFTDVQSGTCGQSVYTLTLHPAHSRHDFHGNGFVYVAMCGTDGLVTEANISTQ